MTNDKNPSDKRLFNMITHKLNSDIQKTRNETFSLYITNLSLGDHLLWKATFFVFLAAPL